MQSPGLVAGGVPRTAASIVWEYFQVDQLPDGKQTATCTLCKRTHAVNMTRLRQHLLEDCPECPAGIKELLQDDSGKQQSDHTTTEMIGQDDSMAVDPPQLADQIGQPDLTPQPLPPAEYVLAPPPHAMPRLQCMPEKLVGKDVPIPPRPSGLRYSGTSSSWIQLEMFMDPVCPFSKGAWAQMKCVAMHYRDKVSIVVHLFPLPYHRNSFVISQIALTLGKEHTRAFFIWMEHILANQEALTNKATAAYSRAQVAAMLVQMGAEIGLGEERISIALADPSCDHSTRVSWKYGCTRGVCGTPMFLVNGVMVSGCATWDVRKWRQLLDPLLGLGAA